MQQDIQQLASDFLLLLKKEESADHLVAQFSDISLEQLKDELTDDEAKKTFWINCYNAFFLYLRKELNLQKPTIYRSKEIVFKDLKLSLDDIEHGILRKNRWKFSLGYFGNPFAPRALKELAVNKLDFRIHFALNCGAKSCPPIAFYRPDKINPQLEMATLSFLESETIIKEEAKEIHVTTLFKWFLGDFGGKKGIRSILEKYLNQSTKGYKIVFTPYNWEENLGNFN